MKLNCKVNSKEAFGFSVLIILTPFTLLILFYYYWNFEPFFTYRRYPYPPVLCCGKNNDGTNNDEFTDSVEEISSSSTSTSKPSSVISLETLMNNTQLARKPYRGDTHCQNFTKRLMTPDFFNLTALVSFPGSGNTWTRHLIELASGLYTGSIYCDLDLISKGFLGEKEDWTSGTTIVQKSHESFNPKFGFSKAILLIRNPYASIISFVQYLDAGHTGSTSGHIFRKLGWEQYCLGQTYKWISLLKSWIEAATNSIPIHIVHYENLKLNSDEELAKICEFLTIECNYLNSTCFKRHQEGQFHRKRRFRIAPNFPPWVREKMDNGIDFLNAILEKTRNETLPLAHYAFYRNNSVV